MSDNIKITGELSVVESTLLNEYIRTFHFKNTVLMKGKNAVIRSLSNYIGGSFDFYIEKMIFGNGGEENSVLRVIDGGRETLFGDLVETVNAAPSFPIDVMNQVNFTSTLSGAMGVGSTINEAALVLRDGSLFSMLVFPSIPKTSDRVLTFNWTLTVV